MLSFSAPSEDPPDQYVYDPNDHLPTRAGPALRMMMCLSDQTKIEQREDVLVYTSAVLNEGIESTGPLPIKTLPPI